jgi:hypothetical protein
LSSKSALIVKGFAAPASLLFFVFSFFDNTSTVIRILNVYSLVRIASLKGSSLLAVVDDFNAASDIRYSTFVNSLNLVTKQ